MLAHLRGRRGNRDSWAPQLVHNRRTRRTQTTPGQSTGPGRWKSTCPGAWTCCAARWETLWTRDDPSPGAAAHRTRTSAPDWCLQSCWRAAARNASWTPWRAPRRHGNPGWSRRPTRAPSSATRSVWSCANRWTPCWDWPAAGRAHPAGWSGCCCSRCDCVVAPERSSLRPIAAGPGHLLLLHRR